MMGLRLLKLLFKKCHSHNVSEARYVPRSFQKRTMKVSLDDIYRETPAPSNPSTRASSPRGEVTVTLPALQLSGLCGLPVSEQELRAISALRASFHHRACVGRG